MDMGMDMAFVLDEQALLHLGLKAGWVWYEYGMV
jgi:hypothetical protein